MKKNNYQDDGNGGGSIEDDLRKIGRFENLKQTKVIDPKVEQPNLDIID